MSNGEWHRDQEIGDRAMAKPDPRDAEIARLRGALEAINACGKGALGCVCLTCQGILRHALATRTPKAAT